jgi:predicted transcriptional regulator of viral defense system
MELEVELKEEYKEALSYIVEERQGVFDSTLDSQVLVKLGVNPKAFLRRMKQEEFLAPIQWGRYAVTSLVSAEHNPLYHGSEVLPSILLGRLNTPYYISWHSALSHYHLLESASTTIYAATIKPKAPLKSNIGNVHFVCLSKDKFFGYKKISVDGYQVCMATPEKALLDSFNIYGYSGAFPGVVSALIIAKEKGIINGRKMAKFALQMESPSLNRRIGFLMDRYGIEGSEELLPYLGRTYAVPIKPGSYKKSEYGFNVNQKWRVVEDKLLLYTAENLKC